MELIDALDVLQELIKSWKKLLNEEPANTSSSAGGDSDGPPPVKKEKQSSSKDSSRESTPSRESQSLSQQSKNGEDSGGKSGHTRAFPTSDAVREKCRELIGKALRENTAEELIIFTDIDELAALIEDNIFLIFGYYSFLVFIIFRHIYNMGEKSSTQRERFFQPLLAN